MRSTRMKEWAGNETEDYISYNLFSLSLHLFFFYKYTTSWRLFYLNFFVA